MQGVLDSHVFSHGSHPDGSSEDEQDQEARPREGEEAAAGGFEGPRSLDAIIAHGVSEGRVGPEHLRHLRERLAGDLRTEAEAHAAQHRTWRLLAPASERGAGPSHASNEIC